VFQKFNFLLQFHHFLFEVITFSKHGIQVPCVETESFIQPYGLALPVETLESNRSSA
jgi:hypothetical protein